MAGELAPADAGDEEALEEGVDVDEITEGAEDDVGNWQPDLSAKAWRVCSPFKRDPSGNTQVG